MPRAIIRRCVAYACVALAICAGGGAGAAELAIDAPATLSAAAARIRTVDLEGLGRELARAGLAVPETMHLTLIPEDDPRAREVPRWVVGLAVGSRDMVIFPQRVLPYPYDSVESVLRHEITHLALTTRAGGQRLPRWFHEGVAMSVDRDWGVSGQLRLLFEMARNPGTEDVTRLFASTTQPESALAYALSAALVTDVQRRHGMDTPGRVAAQVAAGVPFSRAFETETGETPDRAAARAWLVYRRWTNWVPALTSGSAIWTAIMVVAGVAYVAVRRRRARRRWLWDLEEEEERSDR
jgi:hypothetical protein